MSTFEWSSLILSAVQAFVIVVTLIYLSAQTKAASLSVKEAARGMRLLAINASADAINSLNEAILDHPELLESLGDTKDDTFAHIIFNRFEQIYVLWRERLVDEVDWRSEKQWVRNTLANPAMRERWDRSRSYFRQDFVNWVEDLLRSG